MIWVMIVLSLVLVLDGVRMRGRLGALATIPTGADAGSLDGHVFVVAPGVTLDDATRGAAIAFARAHDLAIVDLIPRDLPTIRAMSLVQVVDPVRYRRDRLSVGRTAGHAILISADVARRAELGDGPTITPPDEVAFLAVAARLRHFAARVELAVTATTRAAPAPLSRRRAVLRAVFGPLTPYALGIQPVFWALIALGIWRAPVAGWITLGIWHVQPLLALAGTPIRPRDLAVSVVARAPIEVYTLIATLLGRWQPPPPPDPVEARRADYARLATTADGFREPRRETCPICASRDLAVHLRVSDLLQHKPGRFTLERCRGCGHIFQNPRLSIAGLDYYYKDFYDGLGEAGMEFIFGFGSGQYHDRAKMLRAHTTADPAHWLDVGAGHGHFCAAARDDLPATRFDGLDLSESIDAAQRRGWIEARYRGLFPELAPTIAGRYDALSMSHYLEHTLDPRVELAAAHTALAPGGHLLIEVPDPEYGFGKLLGRLWLPWFQPQHLNLLSTKNLERLLREQGFEPVEWHRGAAHQPVDFLFAVMLALGRLAPPSRLPWRPRTALGGVRRAVVWTVGAPFILLGMLADQVLAPLIRRGRISNTYRVLARRD